MSVTSSPDTGTQAEVSLAVDQSRRPQPADLDMEWF
jgi:hypothetical protein